MPAMLERFTFTFETLTPLYLGGPDPAHPHRSVASVKGALRFWYRTVSPAAVNGGQDNPFLESRVFGSNDGQSPFLLRWKAKDLTVTYDKSAFKRDVEALDKGRGKGQHNGLRYFGYPFLMRNGERTAWSPGQRFTLEAVFPRGATPEQRQALTASVWLLGSLGSLGTRSRRGFGSLCLVEWSSDSEAWQALLNDLPLIDERVQQVMRWRGILMAAQQRFADWFGSWQEAERRTIHYPHLGLQTTLWLSMIKAPRWQQALNDAGLKLQKFRDRRPPDAGAFMRAVTGTTLMTQAPERVAFGLPLAFRDARSGRTMTFTHPRGRKEGRWPSLLHVRLVKLGKMYHPLFLRLDGPVPGQTDLDDSKERPAIVTKGATDTPLNAPKNDLLQVFIEEQLKGAWSWMS